MVKTRSIELEAFSIALGWSYCFLWSFSFYPQVLLNYKRKSVVGYSIDFALFNFIGFCCYAIYTCSLKWNSVVRDQYFTVYRSNHVSVEDCLFALHGLFITGVTGYQCIVYDRGGKRNSTPCLVAAFAVIITCLGYFITVSSMGGNGGPVFFQDDSRNHKRKDINLFSWLCFVYLLSTIKIGITFVKYTPQVLLNIKNKSTHGFSTFGNMIDLLGSLLCFTQVLLDGATLGWGGLAGNPMKFVLALVCAAYDTIFAVQFFCIYGGRKSIDEYVAVDQGDLENHLPSQ